MWNDCPWWAQTQSSPRILHVYDFLVEIWSLNWTRWSKMLLLQSNDEIFSKLYFIVWHFGGGFYYIRTYLYISVFQNLWFCIWFGLVWLWFIIQIKTQHRHFDLTNFKMCSYREPLLFAKLEYIQIHAQRMLTKDLSLFTVKFVFEKRRRGIPYKYVLRLNFRPNFQ